jgi:type IV secretory pathway VirB3-like protein
MTVAADEEELMTGPVHIGDTRPEMVPILGIPFSAATPLMFIASEMAIGFGGFTGIGYGLAIAAGIGLPLRWWVAFDWYGVECLIVHARTNFLIARAARWGGASMSHFPALSREVRGMSYA